MIINLNGASVQRRNDTIYITLPKEVWRSLGTCHCPHCQGQEGFWDSLAVSKNVPKESGDYAWTVHRPEQSGSARMVKEIARRRKGSGYPLDAPITSFPSDLL